MFSGSELRFNCEGPAVFEASCTVGVGRTCSTTSCNWTECPPNPWRLSGCCDPPLLATLASGVGRSGMDEDPLTFVGRAHTGSWEANPACIVPDLGQVREYRAEAEGEVAGHILQQDVRRS